MSKAPRLHAPLSTGRRASVIALLSALLVTLGLGAGSASAITYGELDNDGHPAVVLVLMEVDGAPASRCSGTLISPTVVLTAGHCTGEEGEFSGMRVFAEPDVQNDPTYPFGGGPNTVEATAWHTYPGYTSAAFYLNDVGVIELAQPIDLPAGASYGTLPAPDQLDSLKPRASTTFTAVGYGLQRVNNNPNNLQLESTRVRMVAHPHLVQINTGFTGQQSLLLSNNGSTGGTCFGDSGGPNFVGDSMVIAGVTSFGLNGSCGGTGGVFRVDRPAVLDFINQYLS
ncbi:trypsin-like serine protease [Actinotalea sp.]|uniref:S1 family peptidase n=1 Tax=Actinotalea sp. TaxID=1872145 RepID=UPI003563751A